jgi:hypothetical protein
MTSMPSIVASVLRALVITFVGPGEMFVAPVLLAAAVWGVVRVTASRRGHSATGAR